MTQLGEYRVLWDKMAIVPGREKDFRYGINKVIAGLAQYRKVSLLTGVPAVLIGVIHLRESNCDFTTYLGNGEPLNRVTRLVPVGRGPFSSWVEGAIDALTHEGWTSFQQWSLEYSLYRLENYNGPGYRAHGIPSPYLWGGTNVQVPGKYTSDGHLDPNVLDQQLGCAPVVREVVRAYPELGAPLGLAGAPPVAPVPSPVPVPTPRPEIPPAPTPASPETSIWDIIVAFFKTIFGAKK